MASALIVLFLGCWLAGRSGVSGEGSYPKPSISVSPSGVIPVGGNFTIRCWLQRLGMRILFYKDEDENYLTYTDPAGYVAEFPITSARREHGGSYTCHYHDKSGIYSEPSDPVQIIVAGGSESPAPLGLTSPIIAGASAAAAVLLLLLLLFVAFVCYRITRARKGAARRPSSTSPSEVLKAPAQQDPVYASVDEGKEPQTLPQDPDPDGLTYAELNHQALQAKQGGLAPDPDPAQPSVYAAINMSQGGPLQ